MTRRLTFECPIDPCGATLTAELDGRHGRYVADLTGCEHADAYAEGIMRSDAAELVDWAIARAVEERGRSAMDDADESRVAAWEARNDD